MLLPPIRHQHLSHASYLKAGPLQKSAPRPLGLLPMTRVLLYLLPPHQTMPSDG